MGYKFEFYDYHGNLTRSGVMTSGKVAAMTKEDDYRYLLRSDVYPYEIIREGYFKKSRSVDSKTEIGAFSVSKYSEVEFILNEEVKDIEYVINGKKAPFKKNGNIITAQNTPGTHQVMNAETKEKVWFRVKDLKNLSAIKSLTDNGATEALANKALEDYKDKDFSLHEVLIDLVKKNSGESLLHAQRLMAKFEEIYNKAIKSETKSAWYIDNAFDCSIIPNDEIDKAIVYELDRNRKIFKESVKIKGETSIVLDAFKIYLIEGYKGNLFVSSRIASAVPASSRTEKWKESKRNEERLNYLIQRGRISSSGVPEEIEKELHVISSENMVTARYGAPAITEEDERVVFEIEDYQLATDYKENIYLCLATAKGFIAQEYWLKSLISSSEVTIDTFDTGLSSEETYYVWIENHLGDKVSEFNVLFPKEVAEEYSMIFLDYFVQKEREVVVQKVIDAKKEQYEKLIDEYYTSMSGSSNRVTRLTGLIEELYRIGTWDTTYMIFDIIYDTLTKNDIKVDAFFDADIAFSKWTRRMTIPKTGRDFVLVVHSFNESTKKVTKRIIANPEQFDVPEEHAIIQFLDLNDNVSSHYAFVGGRSKNTIHVNRGLRIEVNDDVYVRNTK